MKLHRESLIAAATGLGAMSLLALLILVGSRNLDHFDAALVAYTFGTLFAVFGIVYRYAMWLQRPPTWMYFKRGWRIFLAPSSLARNLVLWVRRLIGQFAFNRFIFSRSPGRGLAHMLIMWGCILAGAVTFPLVFGWIHFETPPNDFAHYRILVFGFPVGLMAIDGWLAEITFHALVWASFLVLPGVMLAMRRRMKDRGVEAVQRFGEDMLPLLLLFAITVTGLALWVSYSWMHGYAYEFLAIVHAATVIFTLLWLPFGKFFHIFQRPAQLGVTFYKDAGVRGKQASCRRCGENYASQLQVDDLIEVERNLGYRYELADDSDHYQRYCPRCRRVMAAKAQSAAFRESPDWTPQGEILE
ncbi:MAG: MFS transporter [Bryobacterales bacterium]|nr:MFS transporter [Acidobacteriota bacterium]MCB9385183.1 MFS transporter [Bryobacterales bacterium]